MLHTMRWFESSDPVSLFDIRQADCAGIVSALHQLPVGAVWPVAEIRARQQLIAADNQTHSPLHWAVVESLPVHEDIKKGRSRREEYIANYQQSLRNLTACGLRTVVPPPCCSATSSCSFCAWPPWPLALYLNL